MPKARYMALADRLADDIARGILAPGTRLPTHRAFAEAHEIALATATRVYRALEAQGLIVGEPGRGMFVRDTGVPAKLGVQQAAADGLIDLVFNVPGRADDADMLREGLRRLAAGGDLDAMLRYQAHPGRAHERRIIADHASRTLGPIDPEHLLITSGAQHGLALCVLGLCANGDLIGVDPLTYSGLSAVAALKQLGVVPIPETNGVMDPDALEMQCRETRLRALYLMPTVHNPLGTVMDVPTRDRIVEIARRYDLIVIEDGAYAFLEPDPPPSLAALAPERTVHVGSFSKCLATGLRVGFLVAPEAFVEPLTQVMRATTWNTPAILTALVTGWIEDGTLGHNEQARRADGAERQALCRAVLGDVPLLAHRNAGFAWLPLAGERRTETVVSRLRDRGVAVSPSQAFAVGDAAPRAIRLAFGGVPLATLETALVAVRAEACADHSP